MKLGSAGFGGFAESYTGDAEKAFASVEDQALQSQYDEAAAKAAAAMQGVADWLRSKPGTSAGFELGAERFANMVKKTEGVDVSLDELEAIGRLVCGSASSTAAAQGIFDRKRFGFNTGNRRGASRGIPPV